MNGKLDRTHPKEEIVYYTTSSTEFMEEEGCRETGQGGQGNLQTKFKDNNNKICKYVYCASLMTTGANVSKNLNFIYRENMSWHRKPEEQAFPSDHWNVTNKKVA